MAKVPNRIGLMGLPVSPEEIHALRKLVEDIQAFDRYVRTLDELFSCKDLQEGGFPSCSP